MLTVTERAACKALDLAQKQKVPAILRVGVQAGGCHGLRYVRKFVDAARPNDHVWDVAGLQVVCDPKSFTLLIATTLDYEPHVLRAGFRFVATTTKRSCSCGESFAV